MLVEKCMLSKMRVRLTELEPAIQRAEVTAVLQLEAFLYMCKGRLFEVEIQCLQC